MFWVVWAFISICRPKPKYFLCLVIFTRSTLYIFFKWPDSTVLSQACCVTQSKATHPYILKNKSVHISSICATYNQHIINQVIINGPQSQALSAIVVEDMELGLFLWVLRVSSTNYTCSFVALNVCGCLLALLTVQGGTSHPVLAIIDLAGTDDVWMKMGPD